MTTSQIRNLAIAVIAVILSAALFFGFQTQVNATSLEAQAKQATPLEMAVNNGKPTLIEFYANWCNSCQAMAKDLAVIKQKYGSSLNFVMLNVDNDKWLPEVLRYRVDGIPHFVYLDATGEAIANTIGEQPLNILEANLTALIAAAPLPYVQLTGQTSLFTPELNAQSQEDPRSHGTPTPSTR